MVVASNGRFFLTFAEEFHMSTDSFGTRDQLSIDGTTYHIHRLDRIKTARRLPYSLKVLLENLLRNEDGRLVTDTQIKSLADSQPHATQQREIRSEEHMSELQSLMRTSYAVFCLKPKTHTTSTQSTTDSAVP